MLKRFPRVFICVQALVLFALYVYFNPPRLNDEYVGIFDVALLLWGEIALISTAAAGISMSPVAVILLYLEVICPPFVLCTGHRH